MNGIEKISDRLVAEAEAEIAALNAETKAKCDEITAEYQKKAQEEYQSRMAEGVKAAETRLQRLGSAAEMEAKKSILAFKQEMVAKAFADAMYAKVAEVGGDIVGEYGVGYGKNAYLSDEAKAAYAAVKAAFDPQGILNPGKRV